MAVIMFTLILNFLNQLLYGSGPKGFILNFMCLWLPIMEGRLTGLISWGLILACVDLSIIILTL